MNEQANVNAVDEHGVSALLFAAAHGSVDCVKELIAAKADITTTARAGPHAGKDALRVGCAKSSQVASMLLEAKAAPFAGFEVTVVLFVCSLRSLVQV